MRLSTEARTFALAMEDCRAILDRLLGRVEDSMGLSPEEITERHICEADRLHLTLREAAFFAGIGEEPVR